MENTFNIEALMQEVNPVYVTAQRCLQIVAGLGDEDAKALCNVLGFPEIEKTLKENDAVRDIMETTGFDTIMC